MGIKDKVGALNPLWKARLFYLFFEATARSLPQYLGLYYKHTLLLSPHQVAILLSIRPFILLFGSPFLGAIADKTKKFRHILVISLVMYVVTYTLVPIVEPVEGFNCAEHVGNRTSGNMTKLHKLISGNIVNGTFSGGRGSVPIEVYSDKVNNENQYTGTLMDDLYYSWPFDMFDYKSTDAITRNVFVTLLIITIIGEFFASPAETFVDVYTLQTLGPEIRKYGQQIIPGVIGWFIIAVSFGIVTNMKLTLKDDFCHVGHIVNYSPYLFITYGLIVICTIIGLLLEFRKDPPVPRRDDCLCNCNFLKALPVLAETPAYTAYAIAVIFCGLGCGVKRLYVYHYIMELGGPGQLLFIVLTINFVTSIIALYLSPRLIARFGCQNLIAAGLFSIALSFVVYSVIKNAWLIIIVEPIQDICEHLSWVAIVTYAGAPPNIGAALQGTVHGLHRGLGVALGYYAVSVLILKYGYVSFFLSLGLLFFILFGSYVFVIYAFPKEQTIAEAYGTNYSLLFGEPDDDGDDDNGKSSEMTDRSGDSGGARGYENETLDKSFLEGNN